MEVEAALAAAKVERESAAEGVAVRPLVLVALRVVGVVARVVTCAELCGMRGQRHCRSSGK